MQVALPLLCQNRGRAGWRQAQEGQAAQSRTQKQYYRCCNTVVILLPNHVSMIQLNINIFLITCLHCSNRTDKQTLGWIKFSNWRFPWQWSCSSTDFTEGKQVGQISRFQTSPPWPLYHQKLTTNDREEQENSFLQEGWDVLFFSGGFAKGTFISQIQSIGSTCTLDTGGQLK